MPCSHTDVISDSGDGDLIGVQGAFALSLEQSEVDCRSTFTVRFKVSGMDSFELAFHSPSEKLAKEMCSIEPEHMRLIYSGRMLKESDTLACYTPGWRWTSCSPRDARGSFMGGSKRQVQQRRSSSRLEPRSGAAEESFQHALPGSKGNRSSRMSGRLGGNALIRKYSILMKIQEFREKEKHIGFVKLP